jgi:hypothetical protein
MMDTVTPEKCVIVGSGVKNHHEFVDLVKEKIGEFTPLLEQLYERTPSKYIGGELR